MSHTFSRRHFLAVSATATAGAMLVSPGFATQDAPADDPYAGLPMGMQSYSLRNFDVATAIRQIQGLKLKCVEFYGAHFPLDASDEQISAMKKTLADAGIKITAHGVNDFTSDHERNRRVFEFAKKVGFRNITANPRPDSFDSLERLVDEYDIRVCIHNHGPGALYDKLPDMTAAFRNRDERIGACVDTGHVLRSSEDPVKWVRELGGRVYALHIKDVAEQQARTHDVVIGRGHLNVDGLFTALKEIEFPKDGSMSIEYESNPDNPIADIEQCLAVARESIGKVYA
ncbi:MAG: sugar phosphate isomerase/epimerase [Pirellulales bacterium]